MESRTVALRSAVANTGASLRGVPAELRARDGVLFFVTLLHLGLLAAFLVGLAVDGRTIGAEPAWLKPAKFAASIALYTATLAWLGAHLSVPDRVRRRVGAVVGGAAVVEMSLITTQAARGVESHFNTATTLDAAAFYVMGVAVLLMTLPVAWLVVRARGRPISTPPTHPAFVAGVRWGFALFLVGAFQGGLMVALNTDTVGTGTAVPVVGWTPLGDFRVAHFVGLHALQALPLTGYLAAAAGRRGLLARPVRAVWLVAAVHGLSFLAALALAVVPLW